MVDAPEKIACPQRLLLAFIEQQHTTILKSRLLGYED